MSDSAQLKSAVCNPDGLSQAELRLLAKCFLFEGVPFNRLSKFLKSCQCLRLPEKQEIYHRGEQGEEMCILLSGGVKVSTCSANGKEIIFDLLSEGDFFGELSLLDGKPRTATVTTLVPSDLVILKRSYLIPFLENNPVTAIRLLHLLAHRLRAVDALLEEVRFFDSETRLAKRLMALKDIYGKETGGTVQIELKVSQQDIANLVGITRERVNKHLKEWEKAGVIGLQRGRITLRNLPFLQKLGRETSGTNILSCVNWIITFYFSMCCHFDVVGVEVLELLNA